MNDDEYPIADAQEVIDGAKEKQGDNVGDADNPVKLYGVGVTAPRKEIPWWRFFKKRQLNRKLAEGWKKMEDEEALYGLGTYGVLRTHEHEPTKSEIFIENSKKQKEYAAALYQLLISGLISKSEYDRLIKQSEESLTQDLVGSIHSATDAASKPLLALYALPVASIAAPIMTGAWEAFSAAHPFYAGVASTAGNLGMTGLAAAGTYNEMGNAIDNFALADIYHSPMYFDKAMTNTGLAVLNGATAQLGGQNLFKSFNNTIKPVFKVAADVTKSNPFRWRNYAFLDDPRFYNDLYSVGEDGLMSMRSAGNYPLTFSERKDFVTNFKNDVLKGANFMREDALSNPAILDPALKDAPKVEYPYLGDPDYGDKLEAWYAQNRYNHNFEDLQPEAFEKAQHFGTRLSINKYDKTGKWPSQNHYLAYNHRGQNYFPFRYKPNSLTTIKTEVGPDGMVQIGGHETSHILEEMHQAPIAEYDFRNAKKDEYAFTVGDLMPEELQKVYKEIVNKNGTANTWAGAPNEWIAEKNGWRAQYGYPDYKDMTPTLKLHIIDLANQRFGNYDTDFNLGNAQWNSLQQHIPLDEYIESTLDKLLFHKFFTEAGKIGYKKGGKLNKVFI